MASELDFVRCGAKTRNGGECKKPPIRGGTRCRNHGGASKAARAKAAERVLRARLQGDLQQMGWDPVTNPALLLADLAGEARAFKELARAKLNELSDWESFNQLGTESVKAVVSVYVQAMRDVAAIADKMWSRGLDSEALRLEAERPSKEVAETLAKVVEHAMTLLELTPQQEARFPEAMRRALMEEGLI
ncbi:hypothetical protein SAMN02745244_02079 [Tessaracoccus bendigoensis DSM 12906]|uniref:Uncharacterized protein n=1 Tax=Tessaracoccus bendigoensis DSM 12906 TaxID=1123357 RepID=A0A1M6HW43_9ACTN|nr:HGGxSTG domain-containing protein [Tessaracoccus bendigoensis]SHJ26277.1 hypothetical protein SAMN02745244_02079 [Tessaracoccus bendigoensis DSM 12906]